MTVKFAWSKVKVSDLWVNAIDLKPSDFDFGEGYGEKWDVMQPSVAEENDEEREEPMMNTWYPLPDYNFSQEQIDQLHASNFSMCVVYNEETEEYGLAMTGGGMDMSWDIAGAYILLGYTPPAHIRLPGFAGKRLTAEARVTLAAMERSYQVLSNWMASNLRDLKNLRKAMAGNK